MSEIATEVITTIFPFCQHDLLVHVSSVYIGGIGTVWAQKSHKEDKNIHKNFELYQVSGVLPKFQ